MDFDKELVKNTEDITGVNAKITTCISCKAEHTNTGSFCTPCEMEIDGRPVPFTYTKK